MRVCYERFPYVVVDERGHAGDAHSLEHVISHSTRAVAAGATSHPVGARVTGRRAVLNTSIATSSAASVIARAHVSSNPAAIGRAF
ncbi:MAG: hypothetical protein QOE41_803 [Mycobacterium sp.]|jgi:hypothetical protein|nr:hypothetical protein [Mycobacterium sp.]MDT5131492.1 hypothetical protein [Mycobacterium sp.]